LLDHWSQQPTEEAGVGRNIEDHQRYREGTVFKLPHGSSEHLGPHAVMLVNELVDAGGPFYFHTELSQTWFLGVDDYTEVYTPVNIAFSRYRDRKSCEENDRKILCSRSNKPFL